MKSASFKYRAAALIVVAATVQLSVAGCEASVTSVCDAYCDCQGCTDAEFKECIDTNEAAYKQAAKAGCTEQADAYLRCIQGEVLCYQDAVEVEGCDAEYDDLVACSGTGIGFGGCEQGLEKLAECLDINPEDVGECTPDIECNLTCISRATCDEIQNGSQELNECFQECPPVTSGSGGSGGSTTGGGVPPPEPPKPD